MRKAIITGSLVIIITQCILLSRLFATKTPDFSVFYYASHDIFNGINPYKDQSLHTGFMYPPVTGLLYSPFLLFTYQPAQNIFTTLNIFSLFSIVYISIKISSQRVSFVPFLIASALILSSFPAKFSLGMGQSNIPANLLLLLSLYFFLKQRDYYSGAFFICSVILKPILLFMVLFFVVEKKFKTLYFVLFMVVIILAISFIPNLQETNTYYFKMFVPHLFDLHGREIYYNQGASGFISRIIQDMETRKLFIILSDCLIFLIGIVEVKKTKNALMRFSVLLVVLVLLDSLSWQHHFVFLIFPMIYLAHVLFKQKREHVFHMLFALSYILISLNIKYPEAFASSWHVLFLSHSFYGALIVFFFMGVAYKGK